MQMDRCLKTSIMCKQFRWKLQRVTHNVVCRFLSLRYARGRELRYLTPFPSIDTMSWLSMYRPSLSMYRLLLVGVCFFGLLNNNVTKKKTPENEGKKNEGGLEEQGFLHLVQSYNHFFCFLVIFKTIYAKLVLSLPGMPQRLLEGIAPTSAKHQIKALSSMESAVLFFFLGAIVVLILMLILVTVFWRYNRPAETMKNPRQSKEKQACPDLWSGNLHTIICFDYQTLKKATKNFHSDNLLGRGGFGPVYRGKLADGRLVAVKKLALEKSMQGESEFLAEVRMITSIQHKNLVRLLGCCTEGRQRLLVYEYMKNKSLDVIVYGNSEQFLDWDSRFQIILGIARGLQYLHEDSHLRIVHRDIKASNVLLDDKFQPRIGDFGLARFFPEDQSYLSTTFAGTLGYTAPEYATRGELSEKSDIYSFGVLVLEIISCRKNTDLNLPSEMQYLPEYAWKLYRRSRVVDLVDPKLIEHGVLRKDVLHTFHVALLCLQPHANQRPHMSEVVAMLTCKAKIGGSPLKPAFLEKRRTREEDSSWDTFSDALPSPSEGGLHAKHIF